MSDWYSFEKKKKMFLISDDTVWMIKKNKIEKIFKYDIMVLWYLRLIQLYLKIPEIKIWINELLKYKNEISMLGRTPCIHYTVVSTPSTCIYLTNVL